MPNESIAKPAKLILEKIGKSQAVKDFYLAGGTALAIQLGHRESIDLDWFSRKDFSNDGLKKAMADLGRFELTGESPGTIHGMLDGVKVSFFHYDYKLLFPFISFKGINLADERDIAAMKIEAISSRGGKKDFIDIYFLLKKYKLGELMGIFEKKYKDIKYNKLHLLKSLTYFYDAESEPMPKMLKPVGWEPVKEKIAKTANEFLKI